MIGISQRVYSSTLDSLRDKMTLIIMFPSIFYIRKIIRVFCETFALIVFSQPVSAYKYSDFVNIGKPVAILIAFNWNFFDS